MVGMCVRTVQLPIKIYYIILVHIVVKGKGGTPVMYPLTSHLEALGSKLVSFRPPSYISCVL